MKVINTKVLEKIDFTTKNGTHFDIRLPGRITVISGDSGTGKTLIRKQLKDDAIINEEIEGITDNITVFNLPDNTELSNVKNIKHNFIIIDNGDIILANHKEMIDYINTDFDNQYLIFSRGETGIRTSLSSRGVLRKNANEIKAIFD